MDTRWTNFLNWLSRFCLYLIVFLIPLFYLPFTADVMQLNKYFLFYFLTLLSLLCYLIRAVATRALTIRRTPLDLPLLIIWVGYFVSSLFSDDRNLSFFGNFDGMGLSFVGISMMLVFCWLAIQHISTIREASKLLYAILTSGALTAIYFILSVTKWVDLSLTGLPATNPVSPSHLTFGLFMGLVFLLSLGLLATRTRSYVLDGFVLAVLLLSGATLTMIGFKTVWIAVVIALFAMMVFFITHLDEIRPAWSSVSFTLFVVILLFILLGTPKWLSSALPVEVSLSQKISWEVVLETLTKGVKNFALGSGPGTFVYNFSQFRPEAMNLNFAWSVRFSSASSSVLEWLSGGGIVLALALVAAALMVLGLIVATWLGNLAEARRRRKLGTEDGGGQHFYDSSLLYWAIVSGWFLLFVSMFFMNLAVVQWVYFWLLTGLAASVGAYAGRGSRELKISLKTTPQYALVTSFCSILIFTAIIVLGIYLGRFYAAEVVYANSAAKPMGEKIAGIQRAIGLNANRVIFHLALADAFLAQAGQISREGGDINQVYQVAGLAIQTAKRATEISPRDVSAWDFLSSMYANARPLAPEANQWVIDSLEKASQLEPTNPLFYLGIGHAKLLERQFNEAAVNFEKVISLKPDFMDAYVRLANVKDFQGDLSGAISALERGLVYGQRNPVYLVQLGIHYFNRGKGDDYARTEAALRRAIVLSPDYADALYALAVLYERTGHENVAAPLYKRVLELNPGNKEIQKRLNNLFAPPAPPPPPVTKVDKDKE